jgi:succinate dehydrogenase hydrophobic anchor subunit
MSATTMRVSRARVSSRPGSHARLWLRATAVILALFALGHTLGTAAPHVSRGAEEAAVFRAMQGFRFPVMGFTRSYWEFYRGFAITISVLQVALAIVAWQTATVAGREPRAAVPLATTVLATCVGLLIASLVFFFSGPIAMAAAASACAAAWLWCLRRR